MKSKIKDIYSICDDNRKIVLTNKKHNLIVTYKTDREFVLWEELPESPGKFVEIDKFIYYGVCHNEEEKFYAKFIVKNYLY